MIFGVGTDVVEVKRMRLAIERWGTRFLHRIFTDGEISYCSAKKDPYPHFAARFAAKEAVIKALTLPRNSEGNPESAPRPPALRDIEIVNEPSGKPVVGLPPASVANNFVAHISLSHEKEIAIATVVLETRDP